MTTWTMLAAAAASLPLAGCGPEEHASATERGPTHLLLISFDTLRRDSLGCYGYPRPTSPAIDAFAAGAVLFENAVSQAPATKPSHASLLTSLNEAKHGALSTQEHVLDPSKVTLAEILKENGYQTACFNAGGYMKSVWGFDQGFDVYDSSRPWLFADAVDLGTAWLADRRRDQPFFLFLHTYEVHHPYLPATEYAARFRGDYAGPLGDAIGIELLEEINDGRRDADAADRAHVKDLYDAEIRSMDDAFGRLVAQLKSAGLYDDLLIVVTSDHGEEFDEHGRIGWHSHTLFDELLRVPLIIKLPGGARGGTRVEGMVRLIDVLPTVLEILRLPAPPGIEGISLSTAMASGRSAGLISISTLGHDLQRSIRTDRWKLYDMRLYDLEADPLEQVDVAHEHPDVVRRMHLYLEEYLASAEAPQAPTTIDADQDTLDELRQLGYIR